MILLDTNVLSELMRPNPHPNVWAWIVAQPRVTLYGASISKAEILYGIALLPKGQRRTALAQAAEALFTEDLADHVLPFDEVAAAHYAEIVALRHRAGKPMEGFDALIAATALAAGADIATRDVGGFAGCGFRVINPWEAQR
jgi:toxin FitB